VCVCVKKMGEGDAWTLGLRELIKYVRCDCGCIVV